MKIILRKIPNDFSNQKLTLEVGRLEDLLLGYLCDVSKSLIYYKVSLDLKFIYSEKATTFCKNLHLTFDWHYIGKK